jgi:hypothetical protein
MPSLARTLGSWVQGMNVYVCVYSVFMLSWRRADPQSKESYRLSKRDYETEEEARAQQRAVEPLMNEIYGNRVQRS